MAALAVALAVILVPDWGSAKPADPSIYRLSPIADGVVTAGAFGATALVYANASSIIHPRCPCRPSEVNGFDRGAIGWNSGVAGDLSDVTAGLTVVAALALDLSDVGFTRAFLEDTVVLVEAEALNSALVTLFKYTVQRPLPVVYAGQAPDLLHSAGGYRSFYSGHTSLAFAALVTGANTWSRRHPGAIWPWVVTVLAGASVGVERVLAGRHFPTDVLAGAAAGTLFGFLVPALHAREGGGALSLAPAEGGARLSWATAF
jgi:membrane-associated phospholipid phosphatase